MSSSSRSVASVFSIRHAGAAAAALLLALALLACHSSGLAHAQSQCYNGSDGSSCTNYSSTGSIASTSNCTTDNEGNSVCVTNSPDGTSSYSVCTNGTCAGSGGTPASSVKESVVEASWQVPSISYQPCNVPGKGLVWEPSQTITGRLLHC